MVSGLFSTAQLNTPDNPFPQKGVKTARTWLRFRVVIAYRCAVGALVTPARGFPLQIFFGNVTG